MKKIEEKNDESGGIGYNQMPPKDIFAYNELRSCFDLFGLYKREILEIQPEFQRNQVWTNSYQTRFIDSLLKNLPIPSMCFSYDKEKNKMQVIDGLQRISSIIRFLNTNEEWKLANLDDIDPKLSGKTNLQIQKQNKSVFDNIQDVSLPITFLRIDQSKRDHNEYLFEIFHRLNTYGKRLNAQEIRNCIYSGPFNDLIKRLDQSDPWRKVFKINDDLRFLKAELILRFFAFFDDGKNYDGFLTRFLNDYMNINRFDSDEELSKKETLFEDTLNVVFLKIANKQPLHRRASNAFVDALLYGVAKNLTALTKADEEVVKKYYEKFNSDKDFKEENLLEGTMRKAKVLNRLKKAAAIFSGR